VHLPVALHRHPRARRAHRDVHLQVGLTQQRVENSTRGTVLASRCRIARNVLSRGIGLLGRTGIADGEGLLITKTSSITMLFMLFAIDAVFVDRDMRVIKVAHRLRPWVPVSTARHADAVLELPAGTAARSGTQVGDVLRLS
jgi:hypothetical protein